MKMKKPIVRLTSGIIFFVLLSCFSIDISAQSDDRAMITSVIEDLYFEGWMTGDTNLVGKAMHHSCKLKIYRNGEFIETNRNDYLSRFKPTTRNPETSGRILSIDITGNIASAKCELETPKVGTGRDLSLLLKPRPVPTSWVT